MAPPGQHLTSSCLLDIAFSHSVRHERTALLYVYFAPLQGRLQAVLLYLRYVHRHCGYRILVYAFVLCAEEAGSITNQMKEKKQRGKKSLLRIDLEKKSLLTVWAVWT